MADYTAKMGDAKTLVRQLGHDLTATGAVSEHNTGAGESVGAG